MKATIEISDKEIEKFIKESINNSLNSMNINSLIESKINSKVSEILSKYVSPEKIENFARDRVSRLITTESLKDYTSNIDGESVITNIESKILLMIKHSSEFKKLVKQTLKSSL